jgi:hypothetical protein
MVDSNVLVLEPAVSEELPPEAEPLRELADAGLPDTVSLPGLPREFRLGSLGDGRIRVVEPLRVTIQIDESNFVAEAEQINEFGFGESWPEAVRDLQRAIVELYLELDAEESRLGPDLAGTLAVLREKIRRSEHH